MNGSCRHFVYGALECLAKVNKTPGVSVLTYHSLDESHSPISTARNEFQMHLYWLALAGYTTCTLARFFDRKIGSLSSKTVALTFDDGYENLYEIGFPLLNKLGFKATIFVPTGYVGRTNAWDSQEIHIPNLPLLSWGALRELSNAGFEIGSHGVEHVRLSALPVHQIRKEVHDSKKELEDRLGRSVHSFSYPFGDYTPSVIEEVQRAGYLCACTTVWGRVTQGSDPFAIKRLSVGSGTDLSRFRLMVSGGAWLLGKLKEHLP